MRSQVYIPVVNYVLYVLCLLVICVFQTSDRLGAAYGAHLYPTRTVHIIVSHASRLVAGVLQCMLPLAFQSLPLLKEFSLLTCYAITSGTC